MPNYASNVLENLVSGLLPYCAASHACISRRTISYPLPSSPNRRPHPPARTQFPFSSMPNTIELVPAITIMPYLSACAPTKATRASLSTRTRLAHSRPSTLFSIARCSIERPASAIPRQTHAGFGSTVLTNYSP